jgi:hypothetical protein
MQSHACFLKQIVPEANEAHKLQIPGPLTQSQAFRIRSQRHWVASQVSTMTRFRPSQLTVPRYLPKFDNLRRLHLADVSMSSEQAIALAEILPEVKTLAHINMLENPSLASLADAKTEENQEEAAALYASLLAAARVSKALIKVDIENPSAGSPELLKAIANQVVAYCMRNMQGVPDIRDSAHSEAGSEQFVKYPDVLRHLVGLEEDYPLVETDNMGEPAPDEDYVIGGTGVVKALTCCLKNRGDDSRRQSSEFRLDLESEAITPKGTLPSGKAKDMSKHLLASARKIRVRLQPALAQAKATSSQDMDNYKRLIFLDQTIEGIIDRFEHEFPDTRQEKTAQTPPAHLPPPVPRRGASISSTEADPVLLSDTEDTTALRSPTHKRSNSVISHTSRALAEEEGRALRVGHRFRRGFLKAEHYDLITGEEITNDPAHERMIVGLLDELAEDHPDIREKIDKQGYVTTFKEDRADVLKRLHDKDPLYWNRFIESQEKARANVKVEANGTSAVNLDHIKSAAAQKDAADESAIAD